MGMEADMDTVLERFDLLLDRDDDGLPRRSNPSRGSPDPGSGGSAAAGKVEGAEGCAAVKERIARALRMYKEAWAAEDAGGGVLVQVWAPARDGARRVLATRGQPFVLTAPPRCRRLFQYRTVSLTHAFPVGGPGAAAPGERGMPGRVFDAGTPEWTPNVQYYGTGEYARISYALIYDIQAALALPILDPATGARLAVVELVTTYPRLRFADEVHRLCNALQAVELRGSDICCPVAQVCNDDDGDTAAAELLAMSEVSGILTAACEAHQLPLAQAWVRCKRCSSTEEERASLTAAGAPFHLAPGNEGVRGFRQACAEQHLRQGRGGLVEEAAAARGPRFCADVAKYSMDEYPLAHHARFGGLAGCLAVCVELRRGAFVGAREEQCVLEFFLPPDCRDDAAQKAAADAVAATVRERFGSGDMRAVALCGSEDLDFEVLADDDECVLRPDRAIMADTPELGLDDHAYGGYERDSDEDDLHLEAAVGGADMEALEINNGEPKEGEEDPEPRAGGRRRKKKKVGKRKNEKTVSLEELQRYFSGRMKDAARSLGVCPTTMKRICRQHGISRWPFRQIAKANNSLDKVKRIFESVQYSPQPMAASAHQAPAPATAHGPPAAMPCLSIALGAASSQGSCQEPPRPRKNAATRKPFHGGDTGLVTVKASYRGDIVRFRVPSSAGVEAVKGEVAKRLGLEMDAFDVKYLDDDNEWVLLSCDTDFQECLQVVPALSTASCSSASGAAQPLVRLMVQEVAHSHGSSCASSD